MVEAAQRTPVSLLQILCNQKELTPEYELISVEGVSHEPTFTYKLKVKDILVKASGLSKKKAKHSAAKNALDQLLADKGSDTDNFIFEDVIITAENLNDFLLEPVSEPPIPQSKDNKNPISILQEFCSTYRNSFTHPYYETVNESGLPHDKTFVERCLLSRYDNDILQEEYITLAEAKTKKLAKREAAEMMLKKLDIPYIREWKIKKEQEAQRKKNEAKEFTSVSCDESVSPVKSNVNDLFTHEDSQKEFDNIEQIQEIHIDSD